MAMEIDDVESLVWEATDAICSGEYDLGHVTDDCSNSVDPESQEAQVHKSHMDGQWSGASKPCATSPLQHDSTVRHTTICAVCFEICRGKCDSASWTHSRV